jgi:hypothetical protein
MFYVVLKRGVQVMRHWPLSDGKNDLRVLGIRVLSRMKAAALPYAGVVAQCLHKNPTGPVEDAVQVAAMEALSGMGVAGAAHRMTIAGKIVNGSTSAQVKLAAVKAFASFEETWDFSDWSELAGAAAASIWKACLSDHRDCHGLRAA